jgi:hypothetical protein
LDVNDRLGLLQTRLQPLVFLPQAFQFVRLGIHLATPFLGCQRLTDGTIALLAPLVQVRGVETLAAQERSELAAFVALVGFG